MSKPRFKPWSPRTWRAWWSNESGASLVEFAFILPIIVALMGGIMQFGAIFFLQNNMVSVARDTARRVAVGELTETEAETFAQTQLINWGVTFTVDAIPPDPSDPTDTDVEVLITVPMAEAAIIELGDFLGSKTLRATATMRQE